MGFWIFFSRIDIPTVRCKEKKMKMGGKAGLACNGNRLIALYCDSSSEASSCEDFFCCFVSPQTTQDLTTAGIESFKSVRAQCLCLHSSGFHQSNQNSSSGTKGIMLRTPSMAVHTYRILSWSELIVYKWTSSIG